MFQLFTNVGRDIKEVAKDIVREYVLKAILVCVVIVIASIALAVYMERGIFGVIGCIVAVGVFISKYHDARLKVMEYYAYGELVENSAIIVNLMKNSSNETEEKKTTERQPFEYKGTPFWKEIEKEKTNTAKENVVPVSVDSMRFECPLCHTVQMRNRDCCSKCGVKFKTK